jgi:hypothetical protein
MKAHMPLKIKPVYLNICPGRFCRNQKKVESIISQKTESATMVTKSQLIGSISGEEELFSSEPVQSFLKSILHPSRVITWF